MRSLHLLRACAVGILALFCLANCACPRKDERNQLIVSVRDQRMLLATDGKPVKVYKVSTSKFGIGDRPGTNCTPLGSLEVHKKIGDRAPLGAVFKSRRQTGEVIHPNAAGRDPIVTRILWLQGKEAINRNAYGRYIYIHGTPEERRLGQPASYGCIRMGSRDIAELFDVIGTGASVRVIRGSLKETPEGASVAGSVFRRALAGFRG